MPAVFSSSLQGCSTSLQSLATAAFGTISHHLDDPFSVGQGDRRLPPHLHPSRHRGPPAFIGAFKDALALGLGHRGQDGGRHSGRKDNHKVEVVDSALVEKQNAALKRAGVKSG